MPDLAVNYYFAARVDILIGKGDGTFNFTTDSAFPVIVGDFPRSVVTADFNGDNTSDLAVVNYGSGPGAATVLLNQVTQTATATLTAVSVPGSATRDVNATYLGDTAFNTSISATTPLIASPVATTLTLSRRIGKLLPGA
jgi:FG-GAP-like repeat